MRLKPSRQSADRAYHRHYLSLATLPLILAAAGVESAKAQSDVRVLMDPPAAALRWVPADQGQPAPAPEATAAIRPAGRGIGNEVFYDLAIRYTEGTLYNPASGADDPVKLRSYVGAVTSEQVPFLAPRVDIWPGETFRLTLRNELPADDPSCPGTAGSNVPHCFSDTNMHTHGLWVSPAGNGDNVLISINPSVAFQYEYNIPPDHPAGTFWYHSHLHGSTALQVSSGMAGALIIHGDRPPKRQSDGSLHGGDIDTLLRLPDGQPFRDRVLLFQQIAYACRDASGAIKLNPDQTWHCDPGDIGGVEGYDQLTPASWDASGRHTGINGEIVPTLTGAIAGQVERWRMIHGGVRDTIKLRLRKLQPAAAGGADVAAYRAVSHSEKAAYIDQNCTGEPLPALGLATDGLTRSALHERTGTFLQPGYREDLLVLFPEPGTYCLIDGEVNPDQTVNTQPHGRELLGYVEVASGPAPAGSPTQGIVAALVASARSNMPADMRQEIASALEDGMGLAAFVRHPPVSEAEVTGHQSLGFRIFDADPGPMQHFAFEVGELGQDLAGNLVLKDSAPYDPLRIDRTLRLGGVDEWLLTSFFANHPFHIHVNPFQIVDILDAQGNDLSGPGDSNDNEYAGLKGTWKDTLIIREGVRFRVRTRYERYIGEYVLHCHILDHEDQGMMQNVRVAIPSGRGGLTAAHH